MGVEDCFLCVNFRLHSDFGGKCAKLAHLQDAFINVDQYRPSNLTLYELEYGAKVMEIKTIGGI